MFCHIDVDAFFASVLIRREPRLSGKPLLAMGMGGGCVIAASYEAKAKGITTGMRLAQAKALCPDAVCLPSDFAEAAMASREIASILREQCPVVETMSVDEWLFDLRMLQGGIPQDIGTWAKHLQNAVLRRTALTVSLGVAPTALLAKMASEYRKPAGVTIIAPPLHARNGQSAAGEGLSIERFLRDRPAEAIPGIGRRRSICTQSRSWTTAWDIAQADTETLVHLFGSPGRDMQQELRGSPVRGVVEDEDPPQSISRCRSFRITGDAELVFAHLVDHLTYSILKLRREGLSCRDLAVWLRNAAYAHRGTRIRLPQPMATVEELLPFLRGAFHALWTPGMRCTQAGVALSGFAAHGPTQYSLFRDPHQNDASEAVQRALDTISAKFGRASVFRASALNTHRTDIPHVHAWDMGRRTRKAHGWISTHNIARQRTAGFRAQPFPQDGMEMLPLQADEERS